jgi:pyruvate/2-oxoglutarate dehydrogenase complex dihydrolipoamide acyltransferase (E2) component
MGPDHPDGIDIGLDAGGSKSVYAAASGTIVFAGGDDDEPLGISIVISHTNGITTTYGHLEELLVDEGDQVVVGQAIGIGGSTGNSSGDHLHFELRRDGHTIDPLDVLTVDVSTPPRLWIDCQALSFTVPGGAEARLDFRELLAPRERIVRARAVPAGDAGSLAAAIQDGFQVRVQTPLDFAGPDRLQAYSLDLTVDSPAENYTLSCPFAVQYRNVPTTFYVRAAPDTEEVAATMLEPPAPTPTQGPSPHYGVPSSAGFEAASPEFNSPRIASPGGQSPQYGLPGAPSPTPQP